MSILLGVIFIVLLFVAGFALSCAIFTCKNKVYLIANAFPIGAMGYIGIQLLSLFTKNPWSSLFIFALFCWLILVIFSLINRKIPKKNLISCESTICLSNYDYLLLIINAVLWTIYLLSFVGYDEINHFFHASQLCNSETPPCGYSFCQYPIKYHYGWDILLASLTNASTLPFPISSDLLTLAFIISASILLLVFIKRLTSSQKLLYTLFFFLFFWGYSPISLITFKKYLSFSAMINQHSWCFTVSCLLFCYAFFEAKTTHIYYPYNYICLGLMIIGAPLYAAHSLVIWGLFLAYLAMEGLLSSPVTKTKIAHFGLPFLLGIFLLISWHIMSPGILASGATYDNPLYKLSWQILPGLKYFKYQGAYFFMSTYSAIIFIILIAKIKSKPYSFLEFSERNFINLCVLIFYPMPYFIMMENSSYWDNFCKFNYVGVLASFLPLCEFSSRYWSARPNKQFLMIVFMFVISFVPFVVNLPKVIANFNDGLKQHREPIYTKMNLVYTLQHSSKMSNDSILIVKKDIASHYEVDRVTNKSNVNLYEYIYTNYNDFLPLSTSWGFPILNFYDYNFMYNREAEYNQVDNLSLLYGGNEDAIANINCRFILSTFDYPEYMNRAVNKGLVRSLAVDKDENWSLFEMITHL